MRSNIVSFYDWASEDAMARLAEDLLEERRAERERKQRRIERLRRMKMKWITNVILLFAIAAASFCAGLCVGAW